MLGSNNYLGLTGDPRVKAAARDALERYGTALTGSRLMNGTFPLHRELEQEIADWMGTEDGAGLHDGLPGQRRLPLGGAGRHRHRDRGLRRPRLDPRRLQDVGRAAAPLPPPAPGQARAHARPCRRRRRRRPGGRGRRLLDGGRRLRRRRGRGPLPRLRRAPDGGRGPWRGRARRPGNGRLRAARRRGPRGPANGHLLQVTRQLRRLHRRPGRGDRLPADRLASFPLHGCGSPSGDGRGARGGPDLPLCRGAGAVPASARQRRVPARRPEGPGLSRRRAERRSATAPR